jgi:hypothetical protein
MKDISNYISDRDANYASDTNEDDIEDEDGVDIDEISSNYGNVFKNIVFDLIIINLVN